VIRITTPHIPLPAAEALEDISIPSADRIYQSILEALD
jgi:pyruvate dehydrogenase E1 component beta subunit